MIIPIFYFNKMVYFNKVCIYNLNTNMEFNIFEKKEHAYVLGLLQSDGNLYETSRNRGRLTIELKNIDENILYKITDLFDCYSSITNRNRQIEIKDYKYDFNSVKFSLFDLDVRKQINTYLPSSKKSEVIKKPDGIIEIDYWRGIIDGDGSLGFTKKGLPFISLVTKSDILAKQYIDFLEPIIGYKKESNLNKRDKIRNIMVTNENAQKIIDVLYYDNCLSINRKYEMSKKILNWIRPNYVIKQGYRKRWSVEDDEYVLTHTISESIISLKRTEKSIKMRLFRLKY